MKIGVMVGSNKKDSYNMEVARVIIEAGKESNDQVELLDISNLPMYNEDIENDKIESVDKLRDDVRDLDGVIFITPEHNLSIPAYLKNAIDWLSRVDKVLIGKPGMVVGASLGFLGTVNAQKHLRDILYSPGVGVVTLPGNQIYIGSIHTKVDENGRIIDKDTIGLLNTTFGKFKEWIKKVN